MFVFCCVLVCWGDKVLLVKLFKINQRAYYRQNLREVDASINLDGLTAWEERTVKFDDVDPFQVYTYTNSMFWLLLDCVLTLWDGMCDGI